MVMMYGNIDKSKEKRDDLNLIITNLTKVIGLTDFAGMEEIEKLVKDSLKSALKLKGDG